MCSFPPIFKWNLFYFTKHWFKVYLFILSAISPRWPHVNTFQVYDCTCEHVDCRFKPPTKLNWTISHQFITIDFDRMKPTTVDRQNAFCICINLMFEISSLETIKKVNSVCAKISLIDIINYIFKSKCM